MSEVVVAVIGGLFLLAGALVAFLGTRGRTQADAKTALDARIDARVTEAMEDAWEQIDGLKKQVGAMEERDRKKSRAFANILRALYAQWPSGAIPNLDPEDIAAVEDTIPLGWFKNRS